MVPIIYFLLFAIESSEVQRTRIPAYIEQSAKVVATGAGKQTATYEVVDSIDKDIIYLQTLADFLGATMLRYYWGMSRIKEVIVVGFFP